MRRLLPLLALLAALPARAEPAYERTDAMVAMSDGVRLEASVYLPAETAAGAALPLIVRQHGGGSNKDNPYDTTYGLKAVEAGFALLLYSHRGHGNSEGTFDFFGARTTRDFSEVLDWVERTFGDRVDTSNVGASGYSQGGGESLLPAESDARVKAVAVGNTFADLNLALNPNDCFKFSFATGIFLAAYKLSGARVDDATAVRWGAQLYSDTEDTGLPGYPSTTADLRARSPLTYVNKLIEHRVPVFWAQSWEDQLFPGDHPEQILQPLDRAGIPVHYWFSSGGHAAGPDLPADLVAKEQAMLDWFDQFLRGHDHGFTNGPKVDYWMRSGAGEPGAWEHRTATEWPVPETRPLVLYPRADGTLTRQPGPDELVGEIVNDLVSANLANDAIAREVARNVPGMGDVVRAIPESRNPLDTERYVTDIGWNPIGDPVQAVGAPVIDLDVRSSAHDLPSGTPRTFQIDVKVWDVPGNTLVWRGCTSQTVTDSRPVVPIRLHLWPHAYWIDTYHDLALTISAVDFPTFKPDAQPQVTFIGGRTKLSIPIFPYGEY